MTTSMLPDVGIELREGYAEVGDVNLHYVEAGEGPLIVLLHGFPEFWYGWRQQIGPLAAAASASSRPTYGGTTCRPSRTASPPTAPASWPPTSAVSSRSAAPSPRSWPATTGVEQPPGRSR